MIHFESTVADLSACAHCQIPVLRALDEGIAACVDLVPLAGLPAEITAIAEGLWTYTRLGNGHLIYRDVTRLADPNLTGHIHAQHRCPRR